MKTKILLSFLIMTSFYFRLTAQVTIGEGEEPLGGALLQLKTVSDSVSNGDMNATKGLAFPRVNLTSTYDLFPMYSNDPYYTAHKAELDRTHKGLMVYNIGDAFAPGMYFWDGTQWMVFESNVSIPPTVETLLCENVIFDRQTLTAGVYFEALAHVPYSAGNGGIYPKGPEISSTGVNGLKAQLQAGKLADGSGELIFRIWGTPDQSSPSVAFFHISFPTGVDNHGDPIYADCTIEIGNTAQAKIEDVAVVGPLLYTEEDRVPGYGRTITSPDGQWSVRVFVAKPGVNYATDHLKDGTLIGGIGTSTANTTFVDTDLQLRPNNMEDNTARIMWAAKILYRGDNTLGKTALIDLPQSNCNNKWGGTTTVLGDDSWWSYWFLVGPTTIPPANNPAGQFKNFYNIGWYNTNVFQDGFPELREYLWTRVDETALNRKIKTVYKVTFSMGALVSGPTTAPVATVVSDESASKTTVYLKIEQSTSIE
jgi:hypothetical protein